MSFLFNFIIGFCVITVGVGIYFGVFYTAKLKREIRCKMEGKSTQELLKILNEQENLNGQEKFIDEIVRRILNERGEDIIKQSKTKVVNKSNNG